MLTTTTNRFYRTPDTDPITRVEEDLDRLMESVRAAVTGPVFEDLLPTFARIAALVPQATPPAPRPPETAPEPLTPFPWET